MFPTFTGRLQLGFKKGGGFSKTSGLGGGSEQAKPERFRGSSLAYFFLFRLEKVFFTQGYERSVTVHSYMFNKLTLQIPAEKNPSSKKSPWNSMESNQPRATLRVGQFVFRAGNFQQALHTILRWRPWLAEFLRKNSRIFLDRGGIRQTQLDANMLASQRTKDWKVSKNDEKTYCMHFKSQRSKQAKHQSLDPSRDLPILQARPRLFPFSFFVLFSYSQ